MRFGIHPLFVLTAVVAVIFAATDLFLTLTIAVLLHETAHALVAKKMGALVTRVTLTPFGGALNLQTKILTVQQKSLIYWAGPIASLFFSLLFGVMVWLFPTFFCYLEYLVAANFLVGVINLLPIYPLDGGKILAQFLPAKYIFIGSDIVFVLVLLISLICGNWWWTFFAITVLMQINWGFKQSIFTDKFAYRSNLKSGKFIRCAVLSQQTLFNVYQMIDKKNPTEFVLTDRDNQSFYENDLEQWLLKYPSSTTLQKIYQ